MYWMNTLLTIMATDLSGQTGMLWNNGVDVIPCRSVVVKERDIKSFLCSIRKGIKTTFQDNSESGNEKRN